MPTLYLDRESAVLHDGRRRFDPWHLRWDDTGDALPPGEAVSPADAVRWLNGPGGGRRLPVGVIGPRNATDHQVAVAEALGNRLGGLGIPLLCGGKQGVMEAAARGALAAGGLTIGFVPDPDWTAANDYISLPLATGIGEARNVLIARASLALIAVGGEYGTLSEMAFGMHFQRPVFALADAPAVAGVRIMPDVEAAVTALLPVILRLE